MKYRCLTERLRDCRECRKKNTLKYRIEGDGGDEYFCFKCGRIYLWNDTWEKTQKTNRRDSRINLAFIKK